MSQFPHLHMLVGYMIVVLLNHSIQGSIATDSTVGNQKIFRKIACTGISFLFLPSQ